MKPTKSNPAPARAALVPVALCILLAVATLILFWPARHHEFVNYDDDEYVKEPHVAAGLNPDGVRWAFTHFHFCNWHPLTTLSHMLDCQLSGLNAGGHHLTNIVIHSLNAVLLLWVLYAMTGARWRSAFVAALFAWHPLHVESVAWVADRKDLLSTSFLLLTLLAYNWHARRPGWHRYVLALVFYALGLMSKATLVTLPLLLLLLDFWPLGRLAIGDWRLSIWKLLREKIPFLVLAAIFSVVAFVAQRSAGAMSSFGGLSVSERLAHVSVNYLDYILKTFWPVNLAMPYPVRAIPMWQVVGSFLALVIVTVLIARAMRRKAWFGVGWLWYLVALVPVIGFVPVGAQLTADRYTYVPLIGLFIIFSWGAAELATRWKLPKVSCAIAAGIVLLACAAQAKHQLAFWKNDVTLFERAIAVTPNDNYLTSLAHFKIGRYFKHNGQTKAAIKHYREAIRIDPNKLEARINLGIVLEDDGQLDDAVAEYREAVRIAPDNYAARFNFGGVLARIGRREEAIEQFKEVLRLKPGFAAAEQQLRALGVAP